MVATLPVPIQAPRCSDVVRCPSTLTQLQLLQPLLAHIDALVLPWQAWTLALLSSCTHFIVRIIFPTILSLTPCFSGEVGGAPSWDHQSSPVALACTCDQGKLFEWHPIQSSKVDGLSSSANDDISKTHDCGPPKWEHFYCMFSQDVIVKILRSYAFCPGVVMASWSDNELTHATSTNHARPNIPRVVFFMFLP